MKGQKGQNSKLTLINVSQLSLRSAPNTENTQQAMCSYTRSRCALSASEEGSVTRRKRSVRGYLGTKYVNPRLCMSASAFCATKLEKANRVSMCISLMLHILASTWKVGVRLYYSHSPFAPPTPPVSGSSSGPRGRDVHVGEDLGQCKNGTHGKHTTHEKKDQLGRQSQTGCYPD